MNTQPEQLLELNLIEQLTQLGYSRVILRHEADLLSNLKSQLEKHNKLSLNDDEFNQILLYINRGNKFDRSKTLRSRIPYVNAQGENKTIQLLDKENWCKNEFQVSNQITMEGSYLNRYDVTLLINGLPLVQIELKKRGLELKEAFKQIDRYQRHSYSAGVGLFEFIQLFVISNGVNTKYYANARSKERTFKQTFYWTDSNNTIIDQLSNFADAFLNPCHLAKMICQYIVLNETHKNLMVLRPYQYYAVEAILNHVKTSSENGYIWHTTGSGKTLTSFKASQILTQYPEVHKVVFVVDRKDLDTQTAKEFNSFQKGSIDSTNNTKTLVSQLKGNNKLIVTTIQKLNNAITKSYYLKDMEALAHQKIVFIFDECHRSQFGATHKTITEFFKGAQMFGFTGTPIFAANATTNEHGKRTTEMLFGKCLHKYVITDAIKDGNVLRFAIEYIKTFKKKNEIIDIEVEDIDESEVLNSEIRREAIVEHIIQNHDKKTHNKQYTAMFCVSSTDAVISYYKLFKKAKEAGKHNLKIATIFSYAANEESKVNEEFILEDDADLSFTSETEANYYAKYKREELESFIQDYNQMFQRNYTAKDSDSFYQYYNDIADKVKTKQIDILLVVHMFLTGFDSKTLNTLYVDKNLVYHGLIQAYSRTNRILDEVKSHGNIVCYRNLKKATDEAIELFANKEASGIIIEPPFEDLLDAFIEKHKEFRGLTPTVESVNSLRNEEEQADFIKSFRDLIRLLNKMKQYESFSFEHLPIEEQEFEDFKSKYLDLYEETKGRDRGALGGKTSIIDDLDFELELIHRDEINVTYIMNLLMRLQSAPVDEKEKQAKIISDLLNSDIQLRSKKELIEKFIEKHLPNIESPDEVTDSFEKYLILERKKALEALSQEEDLNQEKIESIIGEYLFTNKQPLREDIVNTMQVKPKLSERSSKIERVTSKMLNFVNTYISGFVG